MQDDLLYESLTVWETLYFAAMLRLPRSMSTDDKKLRVAKVIAALGLNRCKDTIIGIHPALEVDSTLCNLHAIKAAFPMYRVYISFSTNLMNDVYMLTAAVVVPS